MELEDLALVQPKYLAKQNGSVSAEPANPVRSHTISYTYVAYVAWSQSGESTPKVDFDRL